MKSSSVTSPMTRFLAGLRVIDLSQYIPGPMATLYLADFGADVLKIEPPTGDQMQQLGPRDPAGRPTFYHALNSGKSVQRMNLKDPRVRKAFLNLVSDADVIVEGFRPGVMARLGVDYSVLSAVNPGIILCSISGYGANSSQAAKAGHDANYLAMSGIMSRNGRDGPVYYDPPIADTAGALFAVTAILAALHGRLRSGKGCVIDLALADTLMPLQLMQIADFGARGHVPAAGQTYLNGGAAYYNVYATVDSRHVVLGAVEPKFWENFCNAAQRPDLIPRHGESIPQTDLRREIAAIFAAMTSTEALTRFGAVDCCFTLVQDLSEAMAEKQIKDRQLVRHNANGQLQALFPVRIDGAAPEVRPELTVVGTGYQAETDEQSTDNTNQTTLSLDVRLNQWR